MLSLPHSADFDNGDEVAKQDCGYQKIVYPPRDSRSGLGRTLSRSLLVHVRGMGWIRSGGSTFIHEQKYILQFSRHYIEKFLWIVPFRVHTYSSVISLS